MQVVGELFGLTRIFQGIELVLVRQSFVFPPIKEILDLVKVIDAGFKVAYFQIKDAVVFGEPVQGVLHDLRQLKSIVHAMLGLLLVLLVHGVYFVGLVRVHVGLEELAFVLPPLHDFLHFSHLRLKGQVDSLRGVHVSGLRPPAEGVLHFLRSFQNFSADLCLGVKIRVSTGSTAGNGSLIEVASSTAHLDLSHEIE